MKEEKTYKVCSLCGTHQKLIKAHIIPESFFKELYNDEHYFDEVLNQEKLDKRTKRRKGLYDSEILCAKCDGKLGKLYDDYGAKVFWGYRNLNIKIKDFHDIKDPRIKWRVVYNADVKRIKLFLLSILWRASISKLDFFKSVDLGEIHSERIKSILKENNSVYINDYSILLMHYATNSPSTRQVLTSINKYRNDGKIYYAAMLCGILIVWYISPNSVPRGLRIFDLSEGNDLKIMFAPTQGFEAIRKFLGIK